MKGVGIVPPPLRLHQNGASGSLRQQTDEGLKAYNTYMTLSLLGEDPVPHTYPVGTSPTRIWWRNLQNDDVRFMKEMTKNDMGFTMRLKLC